MEKNNSGKIIVVIVILILLAVLGVLGYIAFGMYNTYVPTANIETSQSTNSAETQTGNEEKTNDDADKENPIDFKEWKTINSEIVAWIRIPDTNVDYPVLQSLVSDDYYLNRDIYGDYKYSGSIYMQYCNFEDFSDRVTVLYGHNMANGTMFADLHKFEDKAFFDSHNEFYIYMEGRKLTYEIVSAYNYDDRHIMNSFNFAEDEVFLEYLNYMQSPHSTVSNVRKLDRELTVEDKVVTLSTCLDIGDGRYLLQGVLVKDEITR